MKIDFTPFFKKYEALAATAEKTFEKMKKDFPDFVTCEIKCTDCCSALFDLSLIEAIYINQRFQEMISEKEKDEILEKANRIDRKIYKIKREAYKAYQSGKDESSILAKLAEEKVRCPLLNDQDQCDLYDFRPITCRLYGIPTEIGGVGRTCGKSGFKKGEPYPTVHLDIIHQRLYDISSEFTAEIKSRHIKMAEILMPLSMALLADFNDEYLGISDNESSEGIGEGKND